MLGAAALAGLATKCQILIDIVLEKPPVKIWLRYVNSVKNQSTFGAGTEGNIAHLILAQIGYLTHVASAAIYETRSEKNAFYHKY